MGDAPTHEACGLQHDANIGSRRSYIKSLELGFVRGAGGPIANSIVKRPAKVFPPRRRDRVRNGCEGWKAWTLHATIPPRPFRAGSFSKDGVEQDRVGRVGRMPSEHARPREPEPHASWCDREPRVQVCSVLRAVLASQSTVRIATCERRGGAKRLPAFASGPRPGFISSRLVGVLHSSHRYRLRREHTPDRDECVARMQARNGSATGKGS
jgi:hypothetical protein